MLQPWWSDLSHRMLYHVGDEAYYRHHHRIEVERNLRELVMQGQGVTYLQSAAARTQLAAVEDGFDALGYSVSGLKEDLTWALEEVSESIWELGQIVTQAMQGVSSAIAQLENTLAWGLAEVIWQQEQANETLKGILQSLHHPRGTQAEELRRRGDELYRNALSARRAEDRQRWMDLALQAYSEAAEHNPADFSVLFSMGVILFFEKGNSTDALHCFREAAALAEPYSSRHAAMSWLHLGYVLRNRGELDEAYKASQEAVQLDSEWPEALYQHAVHSALTHRTNDTVKNLASAITGDPIHFPKAASDPDLFPVTDVKQLLSKLQADLEIKAPETRDQVVRLRNLFKLNVLRPFHDEREKLRSALEELEHVQGYHRLRQAAATAEKACTSAISDLRQIAHNPDEYLRIMDPMTWHSDADSFHGTDGGTDGLEDYRAATRRVSWSLRQALRRHGLLQGSEKGRRWYEEPTRRREIESSSIDGLERILTDLNQEILEQRRLEEQQRLQQIQEEERRRQEEERLRLEQEKREREQQEQRRLQLEMEARRAERRRNVQCEECGGSLGFIDRMLSRVVHSDCR